jgi:hypothetical protein
MEAMIAWIGIRPLAISCPPERRAADAKGAAHGFSQMSTPAVLLPLVRPVRDRKDVALDLVRRTAHRDSLLGR